VDGTAAWLPAQYEGRASTHSAGFGCEHLAEVNMKLLYSGLFFMAITVSSFAQPGFNFNDYFIDHSLRIEYYQVGDAQEEIISLDQLYQEDIWPGSLVNLISPFDTGRYGVKAYDVASNRLIYAKGFDCMFGEYKTTTPALNGVKRTFRRSLRIPMPKSPILLVFERRNKNNLLYPIFQQTIDPNDYHILHESMDSNDLVYKPLYNGDPHQKVDLVFLGEGYTDEEQSKFKADVDRNITALFEIDPYQNRRTDFNIYGILRPSAQSAVDEPRERIYKNTALDASFNAFDLDRYLLTEEGIRMQRLAGRVPCDAVIIIVNSKRYGGGGIYNDYCITTVDHERSKMVFLHEFGHAFAGLADEYYASEVAYNDFYPKGVEPTEPNITALLDPTHVKWQKLLTPGIDIPTEHGKDRLDSLTLARQKNNKQRNQELTVAQEKRSSEKEIEKIKTKYRLLEENINKEMEKIRKQYASVADKVGVFEGAGYSTKGLYRPMLNCLMIYHPKNEFCRVCQDAISQTIDYYCGK
jgi:hypothetical protein